MINIDKRWSVFVVLSLVYGITRYAVIMYIPLLIFGVSLIRAIISKKNYEARYIELLMVSIFIPDNYIIIPIALAGFINPKKKLRINKVIIIFFVIFSMNVLINKVKAVHVFFSLLYILPFISMYCYFRRIKSDYKIYKNVIKSTPYIIVAQWFSTFAYAATNISFVKASGDMDWVTGTLGTNQCNVLMYICSTFSFFLLYDYSRTKTVKGLIYAIFSFGLALSTTSVAYTLILFVSIFISVIAISKIKLYKKITFLLLMGIAVIYFIYISPSWITRDVMSLADRAYIVQRVTKIRAYIDVFYNLPREYGVFRGLFGCGAGQYSSRAALTCGGNYIKSYSKIFPVSISSYTKEYILNGFFKMNTVGNAASSMSSIVAIQGEYGLVGLACLVLFFVHLMKNKLPLAGYINNIFFIGLMFVDNTLEFAKYAVSFWLCDYMCGQIMPLFSCLKAIIITEGFGKEGKLN